MSSVDQVLNVNISLALDRASGALRTAVPSKKENKQLTRGNAV